MKRARLPLLSGGVDVRVLAVLFVAETVVYYAIPALFLDGGESMKSLPLLWLYVDLFGPLLSLLLAVIFRHFYVQGGRAHPWIFWGTLIIGLSPGWLLFLLLTFWAWGAFGFRDLLKP